MDNDYRSDDIAAKLGQQQINVFDILVISAHKPDKPTAINALAQQMNGNAGAGNDRNSADIAVYALANKLRFWDLPLPANEAETTRLGGLLDKKYGVHAPLGYFDLVLILLTDAKQEIDQACALLKNTILPAYPADRIICAINNPALTDKDWDAESNKPAANLEKVIEDLLISAQTKINADAGLQIKLPVFSVIEQNYNLQGFLDHVIEHLPEHRHAMRKNKPEEKDRIIVHNVDVEKCKFSEWQNWKLPTGAATSLAASDLAFYAEKNNRFYKSVNCKNWEQLDIDDYADYKTMMVCNNKLFLLYKDFIRIYDEENDSIRKLKLPATWSAKQLEYKSIMHNGKFWLFMATFDLVSNDNNKRDFKGAVLFRSEDLQSFTPWRTTDNYYNHSVINSVCTDGKFYLLLKSGYENDKYFCLESADGENWAQIFKCNLEGYPYLYALAHRIMVANPKKAAVYDLKIKKSENVNFNDDIFASYPDYNLCLRYHPSENAQGMSASNNFKKWKLIPENAFYNSSLRAMNYNYIIINNKFCQIEHNN